MFVQNKLKIAKLSLNIKGLNTEKVFHVEDKVIAV